MYSQCRYLMKMQDYWVTCIALSWNDNVLSAYGIVFAKQRKRGRKLRNFAPKSAIHLFQNSSFSKMEQVESNTS